MAVLKDAFIVSLFLGMSLQAASSPDSDGVASPGGGREVVSSALDRARSLRAPAVLEKLGGEYEGADFWDENHALLKAAWGELGQLHSYVYAPSPEQALVPAAARALQSSNPVEALLSLTKETEVRPSLREAPPPPRARIYPQQPKRSGGRGLSLFSRSFLGEFLSSEKFVPSDRALAGGRGARDRSAVAVFLQRPARGARPHPLKVSQPQLVILPSCHGVPGRYAILVLLRGAIDVAPPPGKQSGVGVCV